MSWALTAFTLMLLTTAAGNGPADASPRDAVGPAPVAAPAPTETVTTTSDRPAAAPEMVHDGGLSRDEILRVITPVLPDIKRCSEPSPDARRALDASLSVSFVIESDGHVGRLSWPQDTFPDRQMRHCVSEVITHLVFPKPRGGGKVNVTYPFVYSSDPAPSVKGGLRRSDIEATLKRRLPAIRACHSRHAPASGTKGGRLTARFVIGADGTVGAVEWARDTFHQQAMRACVERALRGCRFPPPVGGGTVRVTYPFVFSAVESPLIPHRATLVDRSARPALRTTSGATKRRPLVGLAASADPPIDGSSLRLALQLARPRLANCLEGPDASSTSGVRRLRLAVGPPAAVSLDDQPASACIEDAVSPLRPVVRTGSLQVDLEMGEPTVVRHLEELVALEETLGRQLGECTMRSEVSTGDVLSVRFSVTHRGTLEDVVVSSAVQAEADCMQSVLESAALSALPGQGPTVDIEQSWTLVASSPPTE